MTTRNILSLTRDEKKQFLDSFDHVLSDIDGVAWNIITSISGASDGFSELRRVGKSLTFITNNSVRSEEQCLEKLKKNKIDIKSENLMHPAKTIAEYLKSINFDGLIYALAAEPFKDTLRKAGYSLLEAPDSVIDDSLVAALKILDDKKPVKAVIIDCDFNLSYFKLMKAEHYLRQHDCLLIGGATDVHLPVSEGFTILGPGPFVRLLEEYSDKKMLHFGKPGDELVQLLLKRFQVSSQRRVLMIGDMLEQDIRFAKSCGFQSLLVLSGGCSYERLKEESDPWALPEYYANSMADFVQFIEDVENK